MELRGLGEIYLEEIRDFQAETGFEDISKKFDFQSCGMIDGLVGGIRVSLSEVFFGNFWGGIWDIYL